MKTSKGLHLISKILGDLDMHFSYYALMQSLQTFNTFRYRDDSARFCYGIKSAAKVETGLK